MDPNVSEWLNLLFRWTHVVAAIVWIGHLYWFNFVNLQVMKTFDVETRKKVLPEMLPRALYWFRWGAMYTWISGLLLLEVVYYMGGAMGGEMGHVTNLAIGWGGIVAAFFLYDLLGKSPLGKNEMVFAAVSWVLVTAIAFGAQSMWSGRAAWIHVGALLGTIMFFNVWMRIWPIQRKVIAGLKGTGPAPEPSLPALAMLRSKHNTYLSVPLVLMMVSNHFSTIIGNDYSWVIIAGLVLAGWGVVKLLYGKSATPAPKQIGDAAAAAPAPAANA